MKIKIILPLLIAAVALTLGSCEEKIDLNDRYLPVPEADAKPARTVLIEEYTGVNCPNCPNGHERLQEIEKFYNTPENLAAGAGVISVGIHVPAYGDPVSKGGYVTPEASALSHNQSIAPTARIGRRTDPLGTDEWLSKVKNQIVRNPVVDFESLSAKVVGDVLEVSGSVSSPEQLSKSRIHVWVVEDDIVDWQMLPGGDWEEFYVHHAVYRASFTGVDGAPISIARNASTDFSFSIPLGERWNPGHLRAVAFVTDGDAEVYNATQSNFVNK